ncbi:hypothetical protein FIBSPDRAFT_477653 [Athelia psychrophila]|uniref:Uncharacterized protein n=1 Tax=Athelia psychrophila TaxID=1759441 RepID=A0A166V8K5_9AGAM|nr:hypothetical protein FIBSPDRAFT_477653 [Fibularhizoctonia sp. CBS 109695]
MGGEVYRNVSRTSRQVSYNQVKYMLGFTDSCVPSCSGGVAGTDLTSPAITGTTSAKSLRRHPGRALLLQLLPAHLRRHVHHLVPHPLRGPPGPSSREGTRSRPCSIVRACSDFV